MDDCGSPLLRRLLEKLPDAVGHAVGIGAGGAPVIKVYVESDANAARAAAPRQIGGFPVVVEVVGKIVAY